MCNSDVPLVTTTTLAGKPHDATCLRTVQRAIRKSNAKMTRICLLHQSRGRVNQIQGRGLEDVLGYSMMLTSLGTYNIIFNRSYRLM